MLRAFMAALVAVICVSPAATSNRAEPVLSRLVPPPDGQSYFGLTFRLWDTDDPAWGDVRPFTERIDDAMRTELASKKPTLLNVWAAWQAPDEPGKPLVPFSARIDDIQKVESIVGRTGFVTLDWTLTSTTATNGGITTKDIASGALDEYIKAYARAIKADERPILIRLFGGEFNGSWWYGVSPRANTNLTAADFVSAWRRVVDLFRAAGAQNVSWAWVPNAYPPDPVPWIDPDIGSYYPGDDYVDWAGGDAYDVGPPSWLDGPYAFAVAHGKPFYLAEWGVRHNGSTLSPAQQRDWLDAMFDYIEGHVAIKAISYFNYNNRVDGGGVLDPARATFLYNGKVNYQANTNDHDHRLLADSGAGFRATFARRISSQRYVTAATTRPVAAPQKAAVVSLSVRVRGGVAIVRWRGNAEARSYDLAVRRGGDAWRTVALGLRSTSYRLRGRSGRAAWVRVRARDASGSTGAWSAPVLIRFG